MVLNHNGTLQLLAFLQRVNELSWPFFFLFFLMHSMFRMHSRLSGDLSAFFVCIYITACVWVGILCLLGCQPKSGEVTGPDRKIDRPTGSWTRGRFGSANWTVKAPKPFSFFFKKRRVIPLTTPVCTDACDRVCFLICFVIKNLCSPSGCKSCIDVAHVHHEEMPWLSFSADAADCFGQCNNLPASLPLHRRLQLEWKIILSLLIFIGWLKG